MMAFATENYVTPNLMMSDPKYIRYYAELREHDHEINKQIRTNYLLHPCTNEEFQRFYDPIN